MPTLLDERPAPRKPILFGRALVAQQEADRKAQQDMEQTRQFEVRERRLAGEAAARDERAAQALSLQQQLQQLREKAERVQEMKAQAILEASRQKLDYQERAISQFGKASLAIGKLDPKSPEYDERLAEIKATHPDAFTFGGDVTGSLDELIKGKSTAREMYMKATEEQALHARTREEEAQKMQQAQSMGLSPQTATIGGFTFKQVEKPQVFKSFSEAQAAYPNANLRGTVDSAGQFTVDSVGTKASSAYADDAPTAPNTPAAPAVGGRPSLDQIFKK